MKRALWLLCALAGASSALLAKNDARVLRSERLTLYISGQRVGRLTSVDRQSADGQIELLRESELSLRRGAIEVHMNSRSTTVLDKNLRPLRFRFERNEAGGGLRAEGHIEGAQIIVRTTAGGATTERRIPLTPGLTFASALELRSRRGLKSGDHFAGKVVLEELGAVVDASYRVRAEGAGFVIDSQVAGVQQIEKLDAQGRTLQIDIPAMGARAVPEGAAPPPLSTPLDVLAKTVWPAPADMPPRQQLRSVTFRVDGRLNTPVPEDARQKVLSRKKGQIVVQVRQGGRHAKQKKLSAAERQRHLVETPYEPIHDKRIVDQARALTVGAKDASDKIRRLTQFVFEHIEHKDLSRAYAPATATLESGIGDCTEHSVLFSALARASGLPTRLVDGVVVTDGSIGYHEWVEVWVNGEGWRAVDPTFGEAVAGPNRLKLATGSSQPEDLLRMGLSAASALTGLRIRVIAHEP